MGSRTREGQLRRGDRRAEGSGDAPARCEIVLLLERSTHQPGCPFYPFFACTATRLLGIGPLLLGESQHVQCQRIGHRRGVVEDALQLVTIREEALQPDSMHLEHRRIERGEKIGRVGTPVP